MRSGLFALLQSAWLCSNAFAVCHWNIAGIPTVEKTAEMDSYPHIDKGFSSLIFATRHEGRDFVYVTPRALYEKSSEEKRTIERDYLVGNYLWTKQVLEAVPKLNGLDFGCAIPKLGPLVVNHGEVTGFLMSRVGGQNLEKWIHSRGLKRHEIERVIQAVHYQLYQIARQGLHHGNPGPGNIMVENVGNDENGMRRFIVTLIDYHREIAPVHIQAGHVTDERIFEHLLGVSRSGHFWNLGP